ncbi:MAG TPA: triose-phosphate isomerase [Crenotrichaceae bacterium]|nr:triose-phosphate isomerase [Crenotrichaceae bacterium]
MRRSLVIGNWKMHGTRTSNRELITQIQTGLNEGQNCDVAVCVPFTAIPDASATVANSTLRLGAQNVANAEQGAYTGEVSVGMLSEYDCQYALVGHSERRQIYRETDELVAERYEYAIKGGITPVLCIGETDEEREQGKTFAVIDEQLSAVINHCGIDSLSKAVIAYEPVWAIGTGKTATPDQAQEVHAYIRNQIAAQNADIAEKLIILYGGSVKPENAAELFGRDDIDGGLIGGASLQADSFLAIINAA